MLIKKTKVILIKKHKTKFGFRDIFIYYMYLDLGCPRLYCKF